MLRFPCGCLALIALVGCARTVPPIAWADRSEFDVAVTDKPGERAFDILLTSHSSRLLCLDHDAWPSAEGVPAGFDGAKLTTSSGVATAQPEGSAYCPGGCPEFVLKPSGVLHGRLGYDRFGDAGRIAADPVRSLDLPLHPYVCMGRR